MSSEGRRERQTLMSEQNANPAGEASVAPSRFETGAEMVLAGLRQPYTMEQADAIPTQWERFVAHLDQVPARTGGAAYGVVVSVPDQTGFDYMTVMEVSDTSNLPAGFTTLEIPAQKYAVFPHPGNLSTLRDTIQAAFQWLSASGNQATGLPDFLERYGENFNPEAGAGDLEIWLPVKG